MQRGMSVTGPSEESAVATVAEWPHGLAEVLTGAVDAARAAVEEFSGAEAVGDYLGVSYEDPDAATHRFLAHLPGYQGWQWAAVVAAYPGADHATISEVVLVPGPTALLAPQWVPWEQRVRPGDLSPGDLLAPTTDDPRLVPGYTASGDPEVDETRRRSRTGSTLGDGRLGSLRGGRAMAHRRLRPRLGDGAVHQTRVLRLRFLPADLGGRWARCSGYAATSCPPTGMSSTSGTAAARIPTPRLQRAPARRCMSHTTTASSTSWRLHRRPQQPQRRPSRSRSHPRTRQNRRSLGGVAGACDGVAGTCGRTVGACGRVAGVRDGVARTCGGVARACGRNVGACAGVARIACAIRCRGTFPFQSGRHERHGGRRRVAARRCVVPITPVPSPASVTGRQLSRAGTRNAAAAAISQPSAPITMNGHARSSAGGSGGGSGVGQVRRSSRSI